jgi:hypothetical protein
MRLVQANGWLGASLPRSIAGIGIDVTFQQLFLYGAPPHAHSGCPLCPLRK